MGHANLRPRPIQLETLELRETACATMQHTQTDGAP